MSLYTVLTDGIIRNYHQASQNGQQMLLLYCIVYLPDMHARLYHQVLKVKG